MHESQSKHKEILLCDIFEVTVIPQDTRGARWGCSWFLFNQKLSGL